MSIRLKNKNLLKTILILMSIFFASVVLFWSAFGAVWTKWDFQVLDLYYRRAIRRGKGEFNRMRADLLNDRHAAGPTIVLVTHDARVAAAGRRIIHLKDGRIRDETVLSDAEDPRSVLTQMVELEL